MVCDICKKKEATVHLTEIVNEQMTELHLCEDCAKKKGATDIGEHFGLADLLAGLIDVGMGHPSEIARGIGEEVGLKCLSCGLAYKDFRKIGRLGCGDCYNTFKRTLAPLLKKIHGSNQHIGKSPSRAGKVVKLKTELQGLQNRLQKAIQMEEFEEAARLRDKIRELEKKK